MRASRPIGRLCATAVALVLTVDACAPAGLGSPTTPPGSARGTLDPTLRSSGPVSPSASAMSCTTPAAEDLPWWNDRVFYEVFVRSFQDSDGDGVGDLRGLTERLDYLNDGDPSTTDDLGVTGIWLMPVAEAASYHGYDVTDYRSIEADYGTAEDFHALVDAAHDRGIAVIVDLVLNHTSIEHPWFVESEAGSGRQDWYLWADERPRGVVKPGGGRVWHEKDGRFYYGYFWEGMPDLNLDSAEVTAELDEVARFWLAEMAVDGFRLDAIKHLFEEGAELEDVPASHDWLAGFQDRVERVDAEALLVGEAFDVTAEAAAYVPDAADITFDFGYAGAVLVGLRNGRAAIVGTALEESLEAYPPGQRGVFLTNHDQPRVMTELSGSVGAARAAAALLLTAPGVPFVYYGEEIGMEGTKPDERIRTPMAWDGSAPAAGFSTGEPWQPLAEGLETANVASQLDDPDSLLAWYRNLIGVRSSEPALGGAETVVLEASDEAVFAMLRRSVEGDVLVLVNLSDAGIAAPTVDLAAAGICASRVEVLLGPAEVAAPEDLAAWAPVSELAGFESVIVRLEP